MTAHCGSGCCAACFAGWEKTLESAETIPTAQERPISHLASFIPATSDSQLSGFIVDFDAGKQRHSDPVPGKRARRLRLMPPYTERVISEQQIADIYPHVERERDRITPDRGFVWPFAGGVE